MVVMQLKMVWFLSAGSKGLNISLLEFCLEMTNGRWKECRRWTCRSMLNRIAAIWTSILVAVAKPLWTTIFWKYFSGVFVPLSCINIIISWNISQFSYTYVQKVFLKFSVLLIWPWNARLNWNNEKSSCQHQGHWINWNLYFQWKCFHLIYLRECQDQTVETVHGNLKHWPAWVTQWRYRVGNNHDQHVPL